MKQSDLLDRLIGEILKQGLESKFPDIIKEYNNTHLNWFRGEDGVARLILTQDQVALIDDEDLLRCLNHSWFAVRNTRGRDGFYARAKIKGKAVPLHRFILECYDPEKIVDHIFHQTLDCRRSELRVVDKNQSSQNRRGWSNKNSKFPCKYKGVYHRGDGHKYRSVIKCRGIKYELGSFDLPEEAAIAYDKKAIELHGEFAVLNFERNK